MKPQTLITRYATLDELYGVTRPYENKDDSDSRRRFRGATLAEIDATRYAWTQGLQELDRLTATAPSQPNTTKRRIWDEEEGDELDLERLYEGRPAISRRVKRQGDRTRGRTHALYINVVCPFHISAEAMLYKAFAAGRICDAIESAGDRVEIYLVAYAEDAFTKGGYRHQYVEIQIKRSEEALNLAQVVAALTPWTSRFHLFAEQDATAKRLRLTVDDGRGRAVEMPRDAIPQGAMLIDTSDALTLAAAQAWIDKQSTL